MNKNNIKAALLWCCLIVPIYGLTKQLEPWYVRYIMLLMGALLLAAIIWFYFANDLPIKKRHEKRDMYQALINKQVSYHEYPVIEAVKLIKRGWLLAINANQCLFIADNLCAANYGERIFPSNGIRVYQHKQDQNILFGVEAIGEAFTTETKPLTIIKNQQYLEQIKNTSYLLINAPLSSIVDKSQ